MFIKAEPVDHDAQISLPLTQETSKCNRYRL